MRETKNEIVKKHEYNGKITRGIHAIVLWVKTHLMGIVILSAITLLASILSILALVIYLPADYFTREKQISIVANPILRILLRILKNILGVIALFIGFIMLIGPGPGPSDYLGRCNSLRFS